MLVKTGSTKSSLPPDNTIPSREWFAVYYGRKFFNFIGSYFSVLGSLVSKVKSVALSIFAKSSVDKTTHTLEDSPSLPRRLMKRSKSPSVSISSSSSSASTSSSEGTDSENEISEEALSDQPFSRWEPEEKDLFVTIMQTMCSHLKINGSFDNNAHVKFREFHDKLKRVWDRMAPEQKNEASLKAAFDEYFQVGPHPGVIEKAVNYIWPKGKEDMPEGSPRIDFGGIPEVGNSCYLNACVQLIRPEHLNELPPPPSDPKKLEDYEKQKQLYLAARLLLRVKDDPNAGLDEVWVAALILRNLIYDTGVILDCKVDKFAYFRQQDPFFCLEILLQFNKFQRFKNFKIQGQENRVIDTYHPIEPSSLIQVSMTSQDQSPDKLNIQTLVDNEFQEYKGDDEQRRSFTCIQIGPNQFHWDPPLSTEDQSISEAYKIRDPQQFEEDGKKDFTCVQTGENQYLLRQPGGEVEVNNSFNRMELGGNSYIVSPPLEATSNQVRFSTEICQEQDLIQVERDMEDHPILPQFLCLALNRWKDGKKNTAPVYLPENGVIDLTKGFDGSIDNPMLYKVTGVILHSGSIDGGHYTTYATRDNGATWRLYNDNVVGPPINAVDGKIPSQVLAEAANNGYVFYVEKFVGIES